MMKKINATNNDILWLARNIYFEARSENTLGKIAVGMVTLNRVNDRRWPNTIVEVVKQQNQFSWYNSFFGTDKLPFMANVIARQECMNLAKLCVELYNDFAVNPFYTEDPLTSSSNHYFADYISAPKWSENMKFTVKIGRHLFFKG